MAALIESDIPARLDRLPWSRFHWLVVIALGITWVLDGLEVTLAGALGAVLKRPDALGLSDAQVGASATFYLLGAVIGALGFGYATDRLGRKKLFTVTLLLYLSATALTALSWNFFSYALFRALTGAGIGGEYSAINSAIDELIPARVRGRVDLIINGSFWIGAAIGAAASIGLLDTGILPIGIAWRLAFGIGTVLGLIIIFLRHAIPESPRWLMIHGREREAEAVVGGIETRIMSHTLPPPRNRIRICPRTHTPLHEIWQAIFIRHRRRSLLGLALMSSQAFFYNAIFFTYALVLVKFYALPAQKVGLYLFPFALGNFFGPLLLGHWFDSVGRKQMITITYALSGVLLAVSGWLFQQGLLTATTQALCWTVIFFVASAAASSAYLTVSEIFPLEIRGMAIAVFYAAGTFVGGVAAPYIFGLLIQTGSRTALLWGYMAGAFFMIGAAVIEAIIGIKAERKELEEITAPLSAVEENVAARRSVLN
ncbi:MAG TPA: MFS transporter [Candidatus Acidoferrales bacterium]|jgi:MFS family permease|nr:MFS transporter [Candidatus Acidoferrales bacterium]